MWNFLVSGLSVGCTLVLYDGSPLYDPAYLWRLTDELGITIFGTSAKYIDQLAVCLSLDSIRCIHPKPYLRPADFISRYRKSTNLLNITN